MAGGMNNGRNRGIGLTRLARAAEHAQAEEQSIADEPTAEAPAHGAGDPSGPWRPVLSLAKNDPGVWGEALAYALGANGVTVDQLHAIPPELMDRVAARAHAFLIDHRPPVAVDPRQMAPEPD